MVPSKSLWDLLQRPLFERSFRQFFKIQVQKGTFENDEKVDVLPMTFVQNPSFLKMWCASCASVCQCQNVHYDFFHRVMGAST